MKSKTVAYLLWFFLGWLSIHRFYLGKIGSGIIYLITGQLFGIGWLVDLFILGGMVDQYNTKYELRNGRTSTADNALGKYNSHPRIIYSNEMENVQLLRAIGIVLGLLFIGILPFNMHEIIITLYFWKIQFSVAFIVLIYLALGVLLGILFIVPSIIKKNEMIDNLKIELKEYRNKKQ